MLVENFRKPRNRKSTRHGRTAGCSTALTSSRWKPRVGDGIGTKPQRAVLASLAASEWPLKLKLKSLNPGPLGIQRPPYACGDDNARGDEKLDELFHDTLEEIYYAEKEDIGGLPKMAKAAQNEELAAASRNITPKLRDRSNDWRKYSRDRGKAAGKEMRGHRGHLEEGKEIMQEYKGSPALDAGLLAAAQAVDITKSPDTAR